MPLNRLKSAVTGEVKIGQNHMMSGYARAYHPSGSDKMAMRQPELVDLTRILSDGTFRFHSLEMVFKFLELFSGYYGPVAP